MRNASRPVLEQPTFTSQRLSSALVIGGGPEPNILATRDGHIYVSYLGSTSIGLWRSDDGGATYLKLDGSALRGAGDGALAESRTGTLHWVGLGGGGGGDTTSIILVQSSTDLGQHWSRAFAVSNGSVDRPWVDALPDGTVHVTWRQDNSLRIRTSPDGGLHWNATVTIAPSGLTEGPVVHDPVSNALYVAYRGDNSLKVASSHDGGKHWSSTIVQADLTKGRVGHAGGIFPIAAVDEAGTVYVAWNSPQPGPLNGQDDAIATLAVSLSHSLDGGVAWSPPKQVSTPGQNAIFPWLSAGAPGRAVLTWYENQHGIPDLGPDVWDAILVESVTADQDDPVFVEGHLNTSPVHVGQICDFGVVCSIGDRSRGDFFSNSIKPDGQPVVAWVADPQSPGSADVMVGGVAKGTPLR